MRVRIIGLAAAAVLVLGGALYLFLQVTSDPATAASTAASRDDRTTETRPEPPPQQPEPGKSPLWSPPRAGSNRVEPHNPKVDMTASKSGTSGQAPALEGDDEATSPDVDLDAAMDEANKLYDGSDYEAATKQALRVLAKQPGNTRMLRILVSSGCMMGDVDQATKYYEQLPARDQGDMARRCERFNIHFETTAQKTKP